MPRPGVRKIRQVSRLKRMMTIVLWMTGVVFTGLCIIPAIGLAFLIGILLPEDA